VSDFYRMDPGAWDFGTASLSLEEEAAYLRIVNAIHKHKGPVPDQDRVLAGLFRVSTRKARALVKALQDAGKVTIEDGLIWNDRARSDLVQRGFVSISRAESGAKGGRTRAENAAKSLKDKDTDQAIASSREEKRREELSEAKASDENPDFAKQLWDRGVAFLERNGTPNRQAKAMIGKWRKFYQDTDIFDAFAACSKQGVVDPIPWIAARLNGRDKGDGKSTRSETRLRAFLAGAAVAPGMGSGEDCDTSQPLLARR
jgi:uncharacterized protein YdaU (DUF1376 family)